MNWPTVREFLAYCFGNLLGLAAAVGAARNAWDLVTGNMDLPLGLVGLVVSALVASWWAAWSLREYVRPAAMASVAQDET